MRPAVPKSQTDAVRRSMRSNKSRGTKPETLLGKMLWATGARGYRRNYKRLPGKPDLAFNKAKVAVFLHGCFWHVCPHCSVKRDMIPKSNRDYWSQKLTANTERDRRHADALRQLGYEVLEVWECQFERDPAAEVNRVLETLRARLQGS